MSIWDQSFKINYVFIYAYLSNIMRRENTAFVDKMNFYENCFTNYFQFYKNYFKK